jgi:hypothetical protein
MTSAGGLAGVCCAQHPAVEPSARGADIRFDLEHILRKADNVRVRAAEVAEDFCLPPHHRSAKLLDPTNVDTRRIAWETA